MLENVLRIKPLTTLLHENFSAWKVRSHFNFAVFLLKIAFHSNLISWLRQNSVFRGILISRFEGEFKKYFIFVYFRGLKEEIFLVGKKYFAAF